MQEVTLRIWRRASNFDPAKGAAGSWIFGVARNVASDLGRARALDIPIGTVKTRLYQGLRTLRPMLAEIGITGVANA